MAGSLACMPYCTVTPEPTWADWVARGDPVVVPPVYQETVFAAVPLTSEVAVSNGGPSTRCGGEAKKLLVASIAEAATSEVFATVPIDDVRAFCRLVAVAADVVPMVN